MPAAAQQNTIVSSASSGSEPLAMPWFSEPNTDSDHVDEPEHDDNGERDAYEPKQDRHGFTPPTDLRNHLQGHLPLTQEQIADHLGLTLVHVNRTLLRLREVCIARI